MLDIPTLTNGGVVALVIVLALVLAVIYTEPRPSVCLRGHLHTDPRDARACDTTIREDHRA